MVKLEIRLIAGKIAHELKDEFGMDEKMKNCK
jgi:hypothetical protein